MVKSSDDFQFHALQAWGDLCIGSAAPRSNGSKEDTSTLSFEVVKLMLDFEMAHALLYAIHRISLQHPMAASTCASLLLPFEVFTRGSVSDAVQSIADKESEANAKRLKQTNNAKHPSVKRISETATGVSAGPSQRNEASFADDAMLEDGFDADTAARTAQRRQNDFDNNDDDPMEEAVDDYDLVDDGGDHGSEEEEQEMEEVDEMEEDEESDDDEMSSDEDSGVTESEDDSESNSDEDDDDSQGDSQGDTIDEEFDDDGEDQEGFDWNEGNSDDFLEGPVLDESRNEVGGAASQGDFDLDEGWTRIESTGFGGMLLGA